MRSLAIVFCAITSLAAQSAGAESVSNQNAVQQQAVGQRNVQQQNVQPQQLQQRTRSGGSIDRKNIQPVAITQKPDANVIQLAVLLDTSNSMDGLIAQAKQQLWMIVNELSKANKQGKPARMEVALFEYGNSRLSSSDGYIRNVQSFTGDLDLISEKLFALVTNGGDEYCGHVVKSAVNRLQWNPSAKSLKITWVAGNEEFTQGSIDFRGAGKEAKQRHIVVNTIYCGDHREGERTQWLEGAKITGGDYANIDQNKKLVHIDAPQDDELVKLNTDLNGTYVPYGVGASARVARQSAQDSNAMSVHKSVLSKRISSKGSRMYSNESWDLVDAFDKKTVNLGELKKEQLPKELRGMSKAEIQTYVAKKKNARSAIKKRISELSAARERYTAKKRREMAADGSDTLEAVIIASLRRQARAKGFEFSDQ